MKWWCNDVGFCDDLPNDMSSKLLWWLQVVDVFGGNLDFLKIKKLKNVCSDVWTCRKMWKQWMLFLTKTILLNGLLLLILPILAAPAQGEMCLWNNKGGGFHGNHYGSKWWIDCLPNFCCNLRHLLGWLGAIDHSSNEKSVHTRSTKPSTIAFYKASNFELVK